MVKIPPRWIVFSVLSMCMFSYNYTYDTPVALQDQLQREYGLSNVQYNLLFSAYAWPNVVFPIITGVLTDMMGVNFMIIILYFMMLVGHSVFAFGIHETSFAIMLLGRCIYGIGAESFAMAETPLLYEYFIGKELSFALGFNLSFSRLGSAANDLTTYEFYKMRGVVFATLVGSMIIGCFLVMLICLIIWRIKFEKKDLTKKMTDEQTEKLIKVQDQMVGYDATQDTLMVHNELDLSARFDQSMASQFDSMNSLERIEKEIETRKGNGATYEFQTVETDSFDLDEEDEDVPKNKFRMSDFKKFDIRYWLLVVNCCFIYGCVVPWMKIGSSYMQVRFGYSHHKGNTYLMLPYIIAAVVTPIFGALVDKYGYRCPMLVAATITLTVSHWIMGWLDAEDVAFLDDDDVNTLPIVALSGLGFGYSVFCAVIWPSFAVVIPPHIVGTGYGIPTSAYNLVLGLFFLLVGILTKDDKDLDDVAKEKYTDVEWFLLSMSICSIVTVFMLWHADKTLGDLLGLPSKDQPSWDARRKKKTTIGSVAMSAMY